jgi:hypothetical protein
VLFRSVHRQASESALTSSALSLPDGGRLAKEWEDGQSSELLSPRWSTPRDHEGSSPVPVQKFPVGPRRIPLKRAMRTVSKLTRSSEGWRSGPKNLFDRPARDPHPLVHQISPVGCCLALRAIKTSNSAVTNFARRKIRRPAARDARSLRRDLRLPRPRP